MKNLGNLMKQASAMQQKMAEMQEKLAQIEVEGSAGGGMVKAFVNGKGELKRVKLEAGVVDPSDPTMLEDLIVAAYADARGKADAAMQEETQKLMGGLGLPPGFKLPF